MIVSGSDLLKYWKKTHKLNQMCVQPFSSVILICSNAEEQLANYMDVQSFMSVVLICSNT